MSANSLVWLVRLVLLAILWYFFGLWNAMLAIAVIHAFGSWLE
jgi:hypothetical protein